MTANDHPVGNVPSDGPSPLPLLAAIALIAGALLVGTRFVARRAG